VAEPRAFVALSRTNYLALSGEPLTGRDDAWPGEVELLDRSQGGSRVPGIARLVRHAGRYDAVVLDGSVGLRRGYVDQVAAGIIGRRRNGPRVVIGDCTWKRGVSTVDRLACLAGIRAIDSPKLTYCVLSTDELELFPRTWGVDGGRVAFTPFCHTLRREELAAPAERGGGIFAGGDSLRDYGTLVDAVRGLAAPVTIAATELPAGVAARLPANVDYVGRITYPRFGDSIRKADIVVVPVVPAERAGGITVYLNAMAIGKLVVASDTPGARDYIDDRVTGLLVPPRNPDALRQALTWALDRANGAEAERIRGAAREAARSRFSPDAYVRRLLRVARDAALR
jgi:hypothetical protein